ncbi:ankyrin repeat-containing domain protein [Mycena olivaceomarginata]|nr:ankyrin repeat-containing domain protein [Mycena olivaceomarginata]
MSMVDETRSTIVGSPEAAPSSSLAKDPWHDITQWSPLHTFPPPPMAELVGLVASVVQLVDTFTKGVKLMKDLHNAPKEQPQLFSEIQSLEPFIVALQGPITPARRGDEAVQRKIAEKQALHRAISWTLWNKEEAKEDLESIERFRTLLNSWLAVDIWDMGQHQSKNHNDQRQDHYRILTSVSEIEQQQKTVNNEQQQDHYRILTSVQDSANEQHERDLAAAREKAIEWISPLNSFQRQADIFSKLQPGTGQWLLADTEFKCWENGTSQILWCRGIAGAGKTILTSLVIQHLEARNDNIGLAWVYLDHKETDLQIPVNVLGSFLKQLALESHSASSAIQELFQYHKGRKTRPTLEQLLRIFPSIIATYSKVYLIIDAFDEYPEDGRHVLERFLTTVEDKVNIMITSRPHIRLDSSFSDLLTVDIRATDNDIGRYVDMQISKSAQLSKNVRAQPILHNEIRTEIINSAEGMFLLAKLQMDSLAEKLSIKAIRGALRNLSKDLNETYDDAMRRIDNQTEDRRELAELVLIWVAHSKRTLSVRELQDALAIEPGTNTFDLDNVLDIDTIISVCAGLVVIDHTTSAVRLMHATTQNYLESIQADRFPAAQTTITSRCLTYMSFKEYTTLPRQSDQMEELMKNFPFLGYGQYCLQHARGSPELVLQGQILDFLENGSKWEQFWSITLPYWDCIEPWNDINWPSSASPLWIAAACDLHVTATHLLDKMALSADQFSNEYNRNSALYAASYYGHISMVVLLIKSGAKVNAQGGKYGTALAAAAFEGHEQLVQLLIDKGANANESVVCLLIKSGANVNLQGGQYGTALQAAIAEGHESVVELLLNKGADPDVQGGGYYGTPLQAAVCNGKDSLIQLLISSGANINATGGVYGTALQVAAYRGNEVLVRLLIEKGANIHCTRGRYRTTLQAAAYHGSYSIVKLLIDMGLDVNTSGGEFGGELQAAASRGNYSIVQLLVERGARVNTIGGTYRTALIAAAYNGSKPVVQLLLENGAVVNFQGEEYSEYTTALMAAAYCGHGTVVELLLERGANMNAQGGRYGTALHAAAYSAHNFVVELLVKRGADVNAHGGPYGSALQAAAYKGHWATIQLLVEKGANVNADGGIYGTALTAAALQGSMAVVELLLEKGANITTAGEYGSAFQAAAENGHRAVVLLLIDRGVDINSQGGRFGSAIQAAAFKGDISIVEDLVKNGANVNIHGGRYGTAIQAAADGGHKSIIEFLIQKGADVNATGGEYGSPLLAAVCRNSFAIVKLLIDNGADVNPPATKFGTVLEAARRFGDPPLVQLLIAHGGIVGVPSNTDGSKA